MRTGLVFFLVILALVVAGVAIDTFGNTRTNEEVVGSQVRTVTPEPTNTPSPVPTATPRLTVASATSSAPAPELSPTPAALGVFEATAA